MLVLASQSAARRSLLAMAGVQHEAVTAHVDEEAAKQSLLAASTAPRDVADAIAQLKAVKISQARPTDMVLGCDSIVVLENGTLLSKPASREDAAQQLHQMANSRHQLISAAVIAESGRPTWRAVDVVHMTVRPLSAAFIDDYLEAEWPAIAGCVGCYRIEGRGVQLFSAIQGSHFTILGLPILPLLAHLRARGEMLV
ncbi:MAG: nucleoside triphosphate pyrophosphatase [Sphingomonas sp.]|jgi:septum formation protein